VRYDNLARAIRALSDVEALLETVEPKPDYYADAISLRNKSRELLSDKYQDYLFRAERAIRSRDWKDANDNLLVVLEILQDRTDPRYEESYKKLLDVQRRLDRR
jgi:hypothetical protein